MTSEKTYIFYGRASTMDQQYSRDAQLNEVTNSIGRAPDHIYYDQGVSGSDENKPQLGLAMLACRTTPNSVLVVAKPDRIARSVKQVADIFEELAKAGSSLHVVSLGGAVDSAAGKLMLNLLSSIAEFELDLIRTRTKEGLAVAKSRGVRLGSPPGKIYNDEHKHLVPRITEALTFSKGDIGVAKGWLRSNNIKMPDGSQIHYNHVRSVAITEHLLPTQ